MLLLTTALLAGCQTVPVTPNDGTSAIEVNDADVAAAMEQIEGPPLEIEDMAGFMSDYLGAVIADSRGDADTASGLYQKIVEQDPINTAVRERAFGLYLSQGNVEKALNLAEDTQGMEDVAGQPMVQLTRLYRYIAANDLPAAFKALEEAETTSPQLLLLQLARAYMEAKSGMPIEEATAAVRTSEISPHLASFKYYHLGRLYESVGEIDEAQVLYLKGTLVDPSSLFLTLALGELYERRNQPDKALAVYDGFMALNPGQAWLDGVYHRIGEGKMPAPVPENLGAGLARLVFDFGTLMVSQQIYATAQQFFQLALLVDPDYAFANFYIGLLHEQNGQMDAAVAAYHKIPEGTPPYLPAQIRIAESIYADGNKPGAINKLSKILESYPQSTALHQALAQMYYDKGDYQKAIAQYDAILSGVKVPEKHHGMLYFSRGASHERLKQFDAATADLKQALALLPDSPMVLNYLGYMWVDLGINLEQAFGYIKQAMALRPDDGAIIDSLGWAYYQQGLYEEAVKYLEQATSALPADATINAHLGDAYSKLGRLDEARVQWQRALSLSPDRPEDVKALKKKLGLIK